MLELTVREPGPLEIPATDKQTIICFVALIAALQREVMSRDTWWLAHNSAKQMALEMGVPEDVYDVVRTQLETARQARRPPMASMFS
jgi:hypothetical protein